MQVREYRLKRNISQKELSVRVGCSAVYLNDVEHSRKLPSLPTLAKIAIELDVDIGLLIKMESQNLL